MASLARWCALILLACLPGTLLAEPGQREIDRARQELGIGDFKAPSIEDVFDELSALQPIPFEKVWRPLPDHLPQERARMALLAGNLIADGFLVVSSQRASKIEPVGRDLMRLAKGLGIGEHLTKRGRHMIELADHERWTEIRKELIRTQAEAESALLKLKDEEIVHLIGLGGWLRGLEITSTAVVDDYSPDRARQVFKPELADPFIDEIHTFRPRLKNSPLIQNLDKRLKAIREIVQGRMPDRDYSAGELKRIRDLSREANKAIAADQ